MFWCCTHSFPKICKFAKIMFFYIFSFSTFIFHTNIIVWWRLFKPFGCVQESIHITVTAYHNPQLCSFHGILGMCGIVSVVHKACHRFCLGCFLLGFLARSGDDHCFQNAACLLRSRFAFKCLSDRRLNMHVAANSARWCDLVYPQFCETECTIDP